MVRPAGPMSLQWVCFSTGILGSPAGDGISVSSPSLCHCISAAEAKSCFLQSCLLSLVDGRCQVFLALGERITLAQAGHLP